MVDAGDVAVGRRTSNGIALSPAYKPAPLWPTAEKPCGFSSDSPNRTGSLSALAARHRQAGTSLAVVAIRIAIHPADAAGHKCLHFLIDFFRRNILGKYFDDGIVIL